MRLKMVSVAQLVRASDCGSEGRGFESHRSPLDRKKNKLSCKWGGFFCVYIDPICINSVSLL